MGRVPQLHMICIPHNMTLKRNCIVIDKKLSKNIPNGLRNWNKNKSALATINGINCSSGFPKFVQEICRC